MFPLSGLVDGEVVRPGRVLARAAGAGVVRCASLPAPMQVLITLIPEPPAGCVLWRADRQTGPRRRYLTGRPFGAKLGILGAGALVPIEASNRSRAMTSWRNISAEPPASGCARLAGYRGDLSVGVCAGIFRVRDQPIDRPPLDLIGRPRPLIFRAASRAISRSIAQRSTLSAGHGL